ncbi:MAG: hypothetical protein ABUT20_42700, partial [Bacteroidota bacterium]
SMYKALINKNLLSEWSAEALAISSPFAITPKYDRSKVEFIYNTIKEFFGMPFFEVNAGTDKAINKISWLYGLISTNKSIPCYHALYDICLLISYSKTLDPSLQKELQQLKRNPENLRTFFFELFIYRMLDSNKIPNIKKLVSENHVLEGTCELNGKTFLFECRKAFMPKMNELDVKRRLLTDIWLLGQQMQGGVGMICTIKLTRPITGAHRSDLADKLRQYFKRLEGIKSKVTIQYTHQGDYGSLSAIDYDEATLIEIQAKKDYDVLYYVIPPKIPVPGIPDHYRAKISCNFSLNNSQIYKKLETLLKEKKRQHKSSSFKNKIIFLDSESLPEFHMNIFQTEGMYDLELVKQVYNKVGLKDILCIVRRFYNNKGPFILADVIAPDHLQETAGVLKSMLLNYHSILTRSTIGGNKIVLK